MNTLKLSYLDSSLKYFSETIGQNNYKRLTIPPGIWFGFLGLENPFSLILNLADIEHDKNEMEKINLDKINYDWSKYL